MSHLQPKFMDTTEWNIHKINILVANNCYLIGFHRHKLSFYQKLIISDSHTLVEKYTELAS